MRLENLLAEIESDSSLSSYEKYNEKKRLLGELMDIEGITSPSDRQQIENNWVGPDPIATEGGFFDRLGRSASRGVDQLQMNVGAIGEYAGELTGIDALREASGFRVSKPLSKLCKAAPLLDSGSLSKNPLLARSTVGLLVFVSVSATTLSSTVFSLLGCDV